jgi:hypothetical protein
MESPPKLLMTQDFTLQYMMEFPMYFAKCHIGNASIWYSIDIMFPIGGTISSTQDQI